MPKKKSDRVYLIQNDIVMKKWNHEKNSLNGLDPAKIATGSHLYADFICPECGHEWNGIIRDAVRHNGCSVCTNKARSISNARTRLKNGQALSLTNPELLKEWDYIENDRLGLNPDNVMAGTNKKAYWICPKCQYKYIAYIPSRALKKSACPVCSNQKVMAGYNDLETVNPGLLEEWDYEKNSLNGIFPTEVTEGSNRKVNWLCPLGHAYVQSVKSRKGGQGCPICANELQTSFPEQAIFYYVNQIYDDALNRFLLDNKYEIDIYIPSRKIGIEFDGVYYHKNKHKKEEIKEKYICEKGIRLIRVKEIDETKDTYRQNDIIYTSMAKNYLFFNKAIEILLSLIKSDFHITVDVEVDRIKIYEQYICRKKENSIVAFSPELLQEWDYKKNGRINPEFVSINSHKKYYWICPKNHSYEAIVKNRVHGTGCPICAGKVVMQGVNDLGSFAENNMPELLKEWDYSSNNDALEEIYFNTLKSYMWVCFRCGRRYKKSAYERNKGNACPYCAHKQVDREISFGYLHPEALKDWDYEKNSLDPYSVAEHSNKYAYWKCHKCGSETYSIINARSKGYGCKYCRVDKIRENSNLTRIAKRGSLADKKPLLVNEWDFEKNDQIEISPDNTTCGSGRVVWWKCSKCEYNWKDEVNKRSHGKKCPQCGYTPYPKAKKIRSKESIEQQQRKIQFNANITRVKKRGSLRENKPLLAQEWNMKRNTHLSINPDTITCGSKCVVWWKCCKCDWEWEDMIQSRSDGKKCPSCGYTAYPRKR